MQFAVLVDGVVDAGDQAARFQSAQMFLEIERRAASIRLAGFFIDLLALSSIGLSR